MAVTAAEELDAGASAVDEERQLGDAESEEEAEEEPSAGSESDSPSEGDGQEGAQKRKKKKKKKKAGGGGAAAGGGGGSQPPVDPAARKEGDRRFQEAVDQLSHNSEDSMWVRLGGCLLADGKMKKLCESLKTNTTVISLDLSANSLTDEGAKLLAAALGDGRAPDLIDLDLQDNPQIKEAGSLALEELQQHRKTLRVALGPSLPPAPPPQQKGAGGGSGQRSPKHSQQQQQQGGGGQPPPPQQQEQQNGGGPGTLADTVKNNPVISKYFAVGNDEADEEEEAHQAGGGGGQGEEHLGGLTAFELAQILWDQLEQCLDAGPHPNIPAVSEPLRAIAEQVEHEMDNCALPLPASTEMGDLKTFTQWALRKLHVLHSVLDLVPPPLKTAYSKTKAVPAVGTHRAAVAELLAQLLRAECPLVVQRVAASGVLRRCAVIAVEHPNCSAIHGAVWRCLKAALCKSVGQVGLWQQLLGSAPVAAPSGAVSADRGGSLNLAVEAAGIAAAARDAPTIGKRPANVGFALAVCQLLHSAATGEQLGAAAAEESGEGAAAATKAAAAASQGGSERGGSGTGGSGSNAGASAAQSQSQGEQQQQQEQQPGAGTSPPPEAAEDATRAGEQLLAEKPGEHTGLHRVPSGPTIPRAASGAVSDLPEEDVGWERQLQLALTTADAWTDFSSGPDCLLRTLMAEHQGVLGGPRPRPGQEGEQEGEEQDVSQGQIISGQELLMMLRGLNLGGFSGGI